MFNSEITTYDGSLLHQRFAYRYLRGDVNPLGDIMSFRGSMDVTKNLVDLEDALNNDYIHSDDAIQFVWEIPNINRFAGVCFQRLLVNQAAQLLYERIKAPITIKGDDIIVRREFTANNGLIMNQGKASVSICHEVNGANLGHLAININAGRKAPAFAYSTNMSDEDIKDFAYDVEHEFYSMLHDIFTATSKTAIL